MCECAVSSVLVCVNRCLQSSFVLLWVLKTTHNPCSTIAAFNKLHYAPNLSHGLQNILIWGRDSSDLCVCVCAEHDSSADLVCLSQQFMSTNRL